MALTRDLISQFVKATNDTKTKKTESTSYGTIVESDGKKYVQLDGSELLTPVATTTSMKSGERVTVMIKNHQAIVTGNITSPSARVTDLEGLEDAADAITEFEIILADKADISDLNAETARIDDLVSDNVLIKNQLVAAEADIDNLQTNTLTITDSLTAAEADIDELRANKLDVTIAEATYATITDLEATNADIYNLSVTYGDFTTLTVDRFNAIDAEIDNLNTSYATIDFANIGSAAMEYLYAQSGLIENVVVSDGTITGTLVGVTIKGDIIEGNTIVADKLVIQGEDGLYYKLNTDGATVETEQTEYNSLNGSVILAKSVTATQISVDDLVAFDATIGGFNITENAIFSEIKDSEDNIIRGIYMDVDGQFNFGDGNNFIKYYQDEDGNYKLSISAESIMYALNGSQRSIADLGLLGEYVKIGTYEDEPCIELGESDSDFKMIITNTRILFMEGSSLPAYITNQSLHIKKAVIEEELQQGGFVWKKRANGNLGLMWKGVTS